jgi:hypothetical protein
MPSSFTQRENSGSQGHETTGQHNQDGGTNVGQKTQEIASNVATKAQDVASGMAHKASEAISSVGSGMTSLASTIREKGPREGMLGSAAGTVAGSLQTGGEYLRDHSVGDMLGDVTALVRRFPISSLLVGFGVGFLMARMTSRG